MDFTTGSIYKKLIRFMMPILGALILQTMYGAVDILVVGRFGTEESISAVSTGSSLVNMVIFQRWRFGYCFLSQKSSVGESAISRDITILTESIIMPPAAPSRRRDTNIFFRCGFRMSIIRPAVVRTAGQGLEFWRQNI